MRLLLDTCTFLWVALDPGRVSGRAAAAFVDPDNEVWLSAASAWEIAVKHAMGRLPLPDDPQRLLPAVRDAHGIRALPIDEEVALRVARLPPLHRDPFDRLLVSQAITLGLTVVTPDPEIHRYPVPCLW